MSKSWRISKYTCVVTIRLTWTNSRESRRLPHKLKGNVTGVVLYIFVKYYILSLVAIIIYIFFHSLVTCFGMTKSGRIIILQVLYLYPHLLYSYFSLNLYSVSLKVWVGILFFHSLSKEITYFYWMLLNIKIYMPNHIPYYSIWITWIYWTYNISFTSGLGEIMN